MLSLDSRLIMCSTPITCKAFYISRYYTNITLSTMLRTRRAPVFHFFLKHAKKEKHFKVPLVLASALFPTKWAGTRRVHGQGTVDTGTTCSLKPHQQKGTRQKTDTRVRQLCSSRAAGASMLYPQGREKLS